MQPSEYERILLRRLLLNDFSRLRSTQLCRIAQIHSNVRTRWDAGEAEAGSEEKPTR